MPSREVPSEKFSPSDFQKIPPLNGPPGGALTGPIACLTEGERERKSGHRDCRI